MGLKIFILNIVLSFFNFFVKLIPINQYKITFVSLESNVLESDMKMIYDELKQKNYKISCVLTKFNKNNLWTNFCYFLNTIKQLFLINTSKVVIINDNNFVISKFKRKGVIVIQIWHAAGAIKKFGNVIERSYPIANYDYVISNGEYWKKPYSEAFNVEENQVVPIGMPRLDCVVDINYRNQAKSKLFEKYPKLKDKKIILYAPTFRGDIYQGVSKVNIDLDKILAGLGDEYMIIYKCHPLLAHEEYKSSSKIVNMTNEVLHELFSIADCLISDFSSIMFDFSLLNKPIYAYTPDLDEYLQNRGCFVDFEVFMDGNIAKNENELIKLIKNEHNNACVIKNKYVDCSDGKNLERVVSFIENLVKNAESSNEL